MRKWVIFVGAAAVAVVGAFPAEAQYAPTSQPYGEVQGYEAQGYNADRFNNFGEMRSLQERINAIESQIRYLDRRDVIRDRNADRLKRDAERIERRLHRASRDGLNPYEANEVRVRIADLEQRVHYAAANRYGRDGDRRDRWGGDRD